MPLSLKSPADDCWDQHCGFPSPKKKLQCLLDNYADICKCSVASGAKDTSVVIGTIDPCTQLSQQLPLLRDGEYTPSQDSQVFKFVQDYVAFVKKLAQADDKKTPQQIQADEQYYIFILGYGVVWNKKVLNQNGFVNVRGTLSTPDRIWLCKQGVEMLKSISAQPEIILIYLIYNSLPDQAIFDDDFSSYLLSLWCNSSGGGCGLDDGDTTDCRLQLDNPTQYCTPEALATPTKTIQALYKNPKLPTPSTPPTGPPSSSNPNPPNPTPKPLSSSETKSNSHMWLWVILGVVLFILLVVLLYFAMRQRS